MNVLVYWVTILCLLGIVFCPFVAIFGAIRKKNKLAIGALIAWPSFMVLGLIVGFAWTFSNS